MICVQHGSFIDSTADGVQARNLQRELFEDDEQVFHFRLKGALPREVLSNVIDFARAEIGARYSVPEAMRSVAAVRKPRSKRQYCSRLVARVYRNAGIDLVPDADYCSPGIVNLTDARQQQPVRATVAHARAIFAHRFIAAARSSR